MGVCVCKSPFLFSRGNTSNACRIHYRKKSSRNMSKLSGYIMMLHYFRKQFLNIIFLLLNANVLSLENTNKKYEYNEHVFPIKKKVRVNSNKKNTKQKTKNQNKKKPNPTKETRYFNRLALTKNIFFVLVSFFKQQFVLPLVGSSSSI